jgi:hypothetical protein
MSEHELGMTAIDLVRSLEMAGRAFLVAQR